MVLYMHREMKGREREMNLLVGPLDHVLFAEAAVAVQLRQEREYVRAHHLPQQRCSRKLR